jgi:transcriptional regulator with XRE-family HTH domain
MNNDSQIIEKAVITGFREMIGCNLRYKRKGLNLSQEELGYLTGLHPAYLGRVERGQENISLDNITKIAKVLKIELFTLFKKDSSPEAFAKSFIENIRSDMDALRLKTVQTKRIAERTQQILANSRSIIDSSPRRNTP